MSIASEIVRIKNSIENVYSAISTKGGTVPQNRNSANLASAIGSVTGGGGISLSVPNCNSNISSGTLNLNGTQVSGLAYNKYLTVSKLFPISNYNTFELQVKVKLSEWGGRNGNNGVFVSASQWQILTLATNTQGNLSFDMGNGSYYIIDGANSSETIVKDTFYYIKLIFNGSNYIVFVSTDGVNYDEWINSTCSSYMGYGRQPFVIQLGSSRANERDWTAKGCTIDFADTYIKIDNELWWSGMTTLSSSSVKSLVGYEVV